MLPPLRDDLRLFAAAPERDGSPAWVIQDPARNRFFRIGWLEFELLARWGAGDAAALAQQVSSESPLAVSDEDVESLVEFLARNQLVRTTSAQDSARLGAMRTRQRPERLRWLLRNYLFFRVPLVRPTRFLEATLPYVAFLFRPGFLAFVMAATLLGLVMAARQWDVFTHTLFDSFTLAGIIGFAGALALGKTLHELAHAYTATRYGVRVAHMGVAFMVLWPLLYTDTGESWKLADRRQRLAIAAAGVMAELALAGLATLLWSLAPDGGFRQGMFFLATTSWVLTLTINASPFMRFDGYFVLSDLVDMPNLHERSFAQARVFLRRTLLGLGDPYPESFAPRTRAWLIAFAFATWTYRLLVFVAIALAVYHFFFKALGVVLLAVELGWFVVQPVMGELKIWWGRRADVPHSRRAVWLLLATGVVALLVIPWRQDVSAPALLRAERQQLIYSPLPGRIAKPPQAGAVRAGGTLLVLDSPDIRGRADVSRASAESFSAQLQRLPGVRQGEEKRARLASELARELAAVQGEMAELARLEIRAPFAGQVLDVDPDIASGTWVSPSQPLGILVDPASWTAEALVPEAALARIAVGDRARLHLPGDPLTRLHGVVVTIDTARTGVLSDPLLAAAHGGPIETVEGETRVPRAALYRVRVRLDVPPPATRMARVTAVIEGRRESMVADWLRSISAVLVRETGF
ncbi:MAG: HlyD family efflux transporter periplasmic adaptor subunit [bacterium]